MLILSRKENEEIMIGDDIIVKVLEFHEGRVRLGITAPKDTTVHRKEVWVKIKNGEKENEA